MKKPVLVALVISLLFSYHVFAETTIDFGDLRSTADAADIGDIIPDTDGVKWRKVNENRYLRYDRQEENSTRARCARMAGNANTDYAAQQVEKTCLTKEGYKPEPEPEPEPKSKGWFD